MAGCAGAAERPLITLLVAAAAVVVTSSPELGTACIDRAFAGPRLDPWRPFTGHLVHSNTAHLWLNLTIFLPFAWLRERRIGSARLALELLVIATAVAIGIRVWHPGWSSYQGLSGVVYGLIALQLLATPEREKRIAAGFLVVLMAAKSLYELKSGVPLSGRWLEETLNVRYLAGSHCAGLLAGLTLAALGETGGRSEK